MKRYTAHLPGDFYGYGVHVYAESLQDARSQLRKNLGVSRLPAGTSVYESPVGTEYWETRGPVTVTTTLISGPEESA